MVVVGVRWSEKSQIGVGRVVGDGGSEKSQIGIGRIVRDCGRGRSQMVGEEGRRIVSDGRRRVRFGKAVYRSRTFKKLVSKN